MKTKSITIIFSLFLILTVSFNVAAQSARDIMVAFDKVSKESSFSLIEKMKLSTCKYIVQKGKMRAAEEPRVSVLEIVSKDAGVDKKDTYSVSMVIEPIRDKGIGMLTYDYDAPGKDSDNWLYLSVFGKVKRLISSSDNSDESGSFFGTEFSIEDIVTKKIDDYTYKLVDQTTYTNRPVWIIELIPTPERTKKSMYGKTILWMDKERYIILKQDLYDRNGILFKQLISSNVEQIDNVWISRKASMNNLITRRVTNMEIVAVAYNIEIPNEFLTQRTLTDYSFREKILAKLHTYLK